MSSHSSLLTRIHLYINFCGAPKKLTLLSTRNKDWRFMLVGSCLALLIGGCSEAGHVVKDIQDVRKEGEGFIQQLSEHRFQQAEQYLTSGAQNEWDTTEMGDYMKAFEIVHGKIDTWSIVDTKAVYEPSGQSVTLSFKADGKKRPDGKVTMKLVPVKGRWYIDDLTFEL